MNLAHLHLVLTHIPVVGIGFGLVLLTIALVRKSQELQKVSLGFLVVTALITIPVYFTGEPAEELVEHLSGVSEAVVDRHEDAAQVTLIVVGILGAMALAGLVLCRRGSHLPKMFVAALLFLTLGVGGVMAWTANLGGQIRHTEIHTASQVSSFAKSDVMEQKGVKIHQNERAEKHDREQD